MKRLRSEVLFLLLVAGVARADEEPGTVTQAREEFVRGAELAKKNRWPDALVAFEKSAHLRKHAVTTHNIGVCERSLGQYTRARQTLLRALEEHETSGKTELADTLVENARAFVGQIDSVVVRANVTLEPADVDIAVDGRPLERDPGAADTYVAGTRPPGAAERIPTRRFVMLADPGPHVLTIARAGFKPIILNRSFDAGQALELPLVLDKLDAVLVVETDRDRAVVTVDDADVGFAPVTLRRPAGKYHVTIRKKGFVSYESDVVLDPGATVSLRPRLTEERIALTQRWWFWTGAAAVLAGTAAAVYFVTAPDPTRPAPDGGGLGWAADVRR